MAIAIGLDHLTNAELLARVRDAVTHERHATAQLIALLMELDARELYLAQGCSSLFTYCTQALHLGEHAAYARIEAARAAQKFPIILERLADGSLTLTAVGLLKPHLTAENHVRVLDAAAHKSKHDVERLVASLSPQPDAPSIVRNLPTSSSAAMTSVAVIERAEIKPTGPERYRMHLTISRDAHDKLRRVQDLLRHKIPNGDLGAIFDKAISLLLQETLKGKAAATERARSMSATSTHARRIPAAVRRAVWQRDDGRCAFKGTLGRCNETRFVEYHHVIPFAVGGETSVDNVELRCRAHNAYEAREFFADSGPPAMRSGG
jgi:hypothetical protein